MNKIPGIDVDSGSPVHGCAHPQYALEAGLGAPFGPIEWRAAVLPFRHYAQCAEGVEEREGGILSMPWLDDAHERRLRCGSPRARVRAADLALTQAQGTLQQLSARGRGSVGCQHVCDAPSRLAGCHPQYFYSSRFYLVRALRRHAEAVRAVDLGEQIIVMGMPRAGTSFASALLVLDERSWTFESEHMKNPLAALPERDHASGSVNFTRRVLFPDSITTAGGVHDDSEAEDTDMLLNGMVVSVMWRYQAFHTNLDGSRETFRCPHAPETDPFLDTLGLGLLDAESALQQFDAIMRLVVASGAIQKREVLVRKFFSSAVGTAASFGALDRLHPDRPPRALVIFREPVSTVASMANLAAGIVISQGASVDKAIRDGSSALDAEGMRSFIRRGVQMTLSHYLEMMDFVRSDEGRARIAAGQLVVVHFDDLTGDPVGTLRRAYTSWGLPFSADFEARIRALSAEKAAKQNEARKKGQASGQAGAGAQGGMLSSVMTFDEAGVSKADVREELERAGLDLAWIASLKASG